MSFAGRSDLVLLIDRMVEVGEDRSGAAGDGSPVLVLEGCGGSGRSMLLRTIRERWEERTPTVAVDPLVVGDAAPESMRPLLVALVRGLTAKVPGYRVSFPRIVLAHVAMDQTVADADPDAAVATMLQRLNMYQSRGAVIELIGRLVAASGNMVKVPGADTVAPAVAESVAQEIVGRLRRARWVTRLNWNEALAWFRHQDQRFRHDPVRALVQLSVQAASVSPAVRRDVDDLLMAAFLADLRDSFANTVNYPWNALVLLDDGDAPATASFLTTLVRVRQNVALDRASPDPLIVITTSGGSVSADLERLAPSPTRWDEARLADLTATQMRECGPWLRVGLGDLTHDDVQHLARAEMWPADLGTSVVADAVHRLTGGHATATNLVLRSLRQTPRLIDALDEVLCRPGPADDSTVEGYLIDRLVAGLSPRRLVDPDLRDALTTLSAARDKKEAGLLAGLLDTPITAEPVLLTSPTLWATSGPRGHPALAPFVRYLLLRALAARTEDRPDRWQKVFMQLWDHAVADGDVAGKLHHNLALGNATVVAKELVEMLPRTPWPEWLTLLDQTVSIPNLRRLPETGSPLQPADAVSPLDQHVYRLVAELHALADPRLSDRVALRRAYRHIAHSYRQLADLSPPGLALLIPRFEEFQGRADALA